MNLAERIKARAAELGFDLVGIASAGVAPHAKEYADWVASGFAGEMAYLTRDPDRRSDLRRVLADAQSVIVVGLSHYTIDLPDAVKNDPARGLIARYAWGADYHDVMTPRLKELAHFVQEESRRTGIPVPVETRIYVDTGPVLERDWAVAAGLGFFGKNTCLINPRLGSWLFLGVVITDVALQTDVAGVEALAGSTIDLNVYPAEASIPNKRPGCGRCTRCLTACPTDAFPAPHVLDARKCISYLTIELRGSIPVELRPLLGNRIFGCDICQDVCPWPLRFAAPAKERAFYPTQWPLAIDLDRAAPQLIDLARLSEEEFKRRFAGTPILRAKRRGLLRNVAVALGNWGSAEARTALKLLARDPDPLIAEHARWGLTR
jgi:epoxyqueuosine reductase